MKNLDLKSILTIITTLALIGFVTLVLFKIEITSEIAVMFISTFTIFGTKMSDYYFNRDKNKTEKKEGE